MERNLDETILRQLGAAAGSLLRPGDAGYDLARAGWNGRFDHRPGAIAGCRTAAEVAAVVRTASQDELRLAVKSTGHDYAGRSFCDGGLVLDLSAMHAIEIDATKKRARVEPGSTWRRFDAAAQEHALATTGGTVSTVGVAGFTLGGGTGWLARRCGLAIDNLLAAEVVLASGERVRASGEENAELFWGLRGGGANLGVATALEYRLHEVGPRVLGGQVIHPFAAAREVLRFALEYMRTAPEALQCFPFLYTVPPMEPFPDPLHGRTAVALVVGWTGALDEGERALAPLRGFGAPALDTVAPLDYVALQQSFDAGMPAGLRWASRGHYLDAVPDSLLDVVLAHTESIPGPYTAVYLEPFGGAVARVDPTAAAFPHRRAAFGFHIFPGWAEPAQDEVNLAWLHAFDRAVTPHVTGGVYVNLLSDDETERVAAAYGPNYARLRELKRRVDPGNLFRSNHNVPPAG